MHSGTEAAAQIIARDWRAGLEWDDLPEDEREEFRDTAREVIGQAADVLRLHQSWGNGKCMCGWLAEDFAPYLSGQWMAAFSAHQAEMLL